MSGGKKQTRDGGKKHTGPGYQGANPKPAPVEDHAIAHTDEEVVSKSTPLVIGIIVLLAVALVFKFKDSFSTPAAPPAAPPEVEKPDWKPLIDGERALKIATRFAKPRVVGTPGHDYAEAVLKAELASAGITDVRDQKFTGKTPFGEKAFNNIVGVLPGTRKEGVAIAAHYDSKRFDDIPDFAGANDAASAVATVIEIARTLKADPATREVTYYFVFFDGEEAFLFDWHAWKDDSVGNPDGLDDNTYGSRHFVKEGLTDFPVRRLILLDMCGDRDFSLVRDTNSAPEMLNLFEKTSKDVFGMNWFLQRIAATDDHTAFQAAGIPSIDLIDFEYGPNGSNDWWHSKYDTPDKLDAKSMARTGTLVLSALPKVVAQITGK